MRISYTRSVKIAPTGTYSNAQVSVSKTVDHGDLGYTDEEWVAVIKEKGTEAAHQLLNEEALGLLEQDFAEELREADKTLRAVESEYN